MKKTVIATMLALAAFTTSATAQTTEKWMHTDVGSAWAQGFKGQGTRIYVVDDFRMSFINGTMKGVTGTRANHGVFVAAEIRAEAPLAEVVQRQWTTSIPLTFDPKKLDVVNMSYRIHINSRVAPRNVFLMGEEQSIVNGAKSGQALIVKAAGNDGKNVTVTGNLPSGVYDVLNVKLAETRSNSLIFVGALEKHGTTAKSTSSAWYSTVAGSDPEVQKRFLVVGVDSAKMGNLAGTSFGAPQVSAYASILGSKFKGASETAVAQQLLTTARADTINGYSPALHGRGEASLSRALAPKAIK
jgi:hypothetical protein